MVFPYKHPWKALGLGVAIAFATIAATHALLDETALQMATRWTGRISALLFIPVLLARPLVDLFGGQRFGFLLRQRARFGLTLAGNHHVHMVLLTVYLMGEGAPASDIYLNPGLYIYFVLIGMNITSFPKLAKALPKSFVKWLHIIGIYALAAAFFSTLILSQITGEDSDAFRLTYAIVFALCFAVRIAAGTKRLKARFGKKSAA
ncbi:MAG: hypothetical protein ABJ242_07355 [Marinomonas sp.]